jgi:hypothetical protein
MVLHKEKAMFKQVSDLLLKPFPFLGKLTLLAGGTPAPQFGLLRGQLFAYLSDRT